MCSKDSRNCAGEAAAFADESLAPGKKHDGWTLPSSSPLTTGKLPGLLRGKDGERSGLEKLARDAGPLRVAVVHPCDEPSLQGLLAASIDSGVGFIVPVIVAPRGKLEALARTIGADLTRFAIEDVPHSHAAASRAMELVASGAADAVMKGSLHTDELMSAVIAPSSGLLTGKRISHCFLVETSAYERPFIITDAAVNIAPDLEQKREIVQNAIDLAHSLGLRHPRVAVLCAVETVNPRMHSTVDAAALAKMAERGQLTGASVDGPLAFDNAVSAYAARIKGIVSHVAGHADILVVPDLEAGNMLVKQLELLGGAASAGLVVGARVPIILTSRADSIAGRVNSCALAAAVAVRRN
jgi:phosphate acetyltransferase